MNKEGTLGCPPELQPGRVHELSGSGAWVFAFLKAMQGEIMLCGRPACLEALHPESVALFCDPNRVLHTLCPLEADALWAGETALRAGCVKIVIIALQKSPGLTSFRRLQLAAQAGKALGLVIVQSPAHSTPAETRWHCTAQHTDQGDALRLHASLYKNKRGSIGSWVLNALGQTNPLHLDAAPAGEPVWPDRMAY